MNIPKRCRGCAHWVGRFSGDADDPRCNRDWGHTMPGLGTPRLVGFECPVPKWGEPLPMVDDHGNELPTRPGPVELIDGFLPLHHPDGEPRRVLLALRSGRVALTPEELGAYLRMTPQQKKLWEARQGKLATITEHHTDVHKAKMGVVGAVRPADLQPPYARGLERIPTGLINLDYALGGGIIPGLTIGLWGDPSGGKTTLKHCLEAGILNYYRGLSPFPDDEKIVAIMSEGGLYDTTYAARLGVPTKGVLVPQFDYAEQAFQLVADIVNAKGDLSDFYGPDTFSYDIPVPIRLVSVDSIDGLKLWEDVHGAKDKEKVLVDSNKVGAQAMLLSQFFRICGNMPSVPITSIFITQVRTKMGGTAAWDSGHRGKAYPHYIRCEIRVKAGKAEEGQITRPVHLEFRQVQFGANITPGTTITLAMRAGGGFYPKDQCAVVGIERGLIEVKGGGNWQYPGKNGVVKGRGADPGKIADALEAEGVVEEIYGRLVNVMSGRDRDDDGTVTVTRPAAGDGAQVELDPQLLAQASAAQAV